jgi:hypothetical protein
MIEMGHTMRLLTSLFARKLEKNQNQIAGRTAAVIDHVIYDVGIDRLVNGSLSLDKKFRLRFTGERPSIGREIIAAVAISELEEAAVFRGLGATGLPDASTLGVHTGCLVYAVMREFKSQSSAFRSLP